MTTAPPRRPLQPNSERPAPLSTRPLEIRASLDGRSGDFPAVTGGDRVHRLSTEDPGAEGTAEHAEDPLREVLGAASIARTRTLPAMALAPSVELTALASRSRDKAEALAAELGIDRAARVVPGTARRS